MVTKVDIVVRHRDDEKYVGFEGDCGNVPMHTLNKDSRIGHQRFDLESFGKGETLGTVTVGGSAVDIEWKKD